MENLVSRLGQHNPKRAVGAICGMVVDKAPTAKAVTPNITKKRLSVVDQQQAGSDSDDEVVASTALAPSAPTQDSILLRTSGGCLTADQFKTMTTAEKAAGFSKQ